MVAVRGLPTLTEVRQPFRDHFRDHFKIICGGHPTRSDAVLPAVSGSLSEASINMEG
jgi:hypothetical protein